MGVFVAVVVAVVDVDAFVAFVVVGGFLRGLGAFARFVVGRGSVGPFRGEVALGAWKALKAWGAWRLALRVDDLFEEGGC